MFSSACQSWFRTSTSPLPKPLKPPDTADSSVIGTHNTLLTAVSQSVNRYEERRAYKNISIYIADLPATPTRFRDKYHRGYNAKAIDAGHVSQGDWSKSRKGSTSTTSSKPAASTSVVEIASSSVEARGLDHVLRVTAVDHKSIPLSDIQEDTWASTGPDVTFLQPPLQPSPQNHSFFTNRMFTAQARYVPRWAESRRRFHTAAPASIFATTRHYNSRALNFEDYTNPQYTGLKDPEVWANAFIF